MKTQRVLVYGANGLIAKKLLRKLRTLPIETIAAGRTQKKVEPVAKEFGLKFRVFDLATIEATAHHLSGIDLVINCAGPFTTTSKILAEAALRSDAHYFDCAGELSVFKELYTLHDAAKRKNIAIIPGLGLNIAATDCLLQTLATHIEKPRDMLLVMIVYAFNPSHGTLRSILSLKDSTALALRHTYLATLKDVPKSYERTIHNQKVRYFRVPMADLFTAPFSIDIQNADTFLAPPKAIAPLYQLMPIIDWLKQFRFMKKLMHYCIKFLKNGPSIAQADNIAVKIYAELNNADGRTVSGSITTKETYDYVSDLLMEATRHFLKHGLLAGFQTPGTAFGPDFAVNAAPLATNLQIDEIQERKTGHRETT